MSPAQATGNGAGMKAFGKHNLGNPHASGAKSVPGLVSKILEAIGAV